MSLPQPPRNLCRCFFFPGHGYWFPAVESRWLGIQSTEAYGEKNASKKKK